MSAVLVRVWVKPGTEDAFLAATLRNAEASRKEEGNLRFDCIRSSEDPLHFTLFEVYETAAQAAAHKDTEHYKTWRDAVADMMAQPRKGEKFTPESVPKL